jgi:hypothetical protein
MVCRGSKKFAGHWSRLPDSKGDLNVVLTRKSFPIPGIERLVGSNTKLTEFIDQFWEWNIWLDRQTGTPKCECIFVFRVSFVTFTILVTFIPLFLLVCVVV